VREPESGPIVGSGRARLRPGVRRCHVALHLTELMR
jgi:hypothetical protein